VAPVGGGVRAAAAAVGAVDAGGGEETPCSRGSASCPSAPSCSGAGASSACKSSASLGLQR
jgi:hypothetical protein